MTTTRYLKRILDPTLADTIAELPAVLLTGPRAAGKTTTAQRHANTIVRLDQPAEAAVARADPDGLLSGLASPVLIDEWQAVPTILGAVKRAVDADPSPGRFLITGSAAAESDLGLWPGTGRFVRLPLYGLTPRERRGAVGGPALLDLLVEQGLEAVPHPKDPTDLRGLVRELLVPGFPMAALHIPIQRRRHWQSSYLEQVVTRDAPNLEPGRDPTRLRRYLEVLAVHTATVADDATLFRAAGINRRTAQAYDALLTGLSLADRLPAWWSNRVKRLVQRPKRLFCNAALAATAIGIDEAGIMRDGTVLGRLLETFAIAQLRAELPTCRHPARLYHLRTEQGRHEVDVVAELPGQGIIAFEIKATVAPKTDDARHLAWLRDKLGERFVAGVVLHAGPRVFALGDRLGAVPIACLWSPSP